MVVYKTVNNINGKAYIGKDTKNNPKYLGSGLDLIKAIKKYGRSNFKKVILEECSNKDELWKREEYWLSKFNVKDSKDFYNRTNKAFGAWEGRIFKPVTEKTKLKMAMAHKDKPLSEEHKKSISEAMVGHTKDDVWRNNLSKSASKSFGKTVLQLTLDGELIKEWETAKAASKELNLNYTALNNCCRFNLSKPQRKRDKNKLGKYTSFSYIWEYKQ